MRQGLLDASPDFKQTCSMQTTHNYTLGLEEE